MSRHFLQSTDWADFQEALGTHVLRGVGTINCNAFIERSHGKAGKFLSRLYVPYGPTVKSKDQLKSSLMELERIAKEHSVDYLRLEPMGEGIDAKTLEDSGYQKRARSSQPENTRIITIEGKTSEQIIAEMNATNRNLWRRNITSEDPLQFIVDYSVEGLQPFLDMMQETSHRTGAVFHHAEYFKTAIEVLGKDKKCGIVIASHLGINLASALFTIDREGETLYYLHAGSVAEARKYNAGNILVSYLIQFAHQAGLKKVDLFGIAPADADQSHSLLGISNFKRSFGGKDVSYAGTWEKGISKKYKLMSLIR